MTVCPRRAPSAPRPGGNKFNHVCGRAAGRAARIASQDERRAQEVAARRAEVVPSPVAPVALAGGRPPGVDASVRDVIAPFVQTPFDQLGRLAESVQLVELYQQGREGGPRSHAEDTQAPAAVLPPEVRRRNRHRGRGRRRHYSSSISPASSIQEEDSVDEAAMAAPASPPVVHAPRGAPKVMQSAYERVAAVVDYNTCLLRDRRAKIGTKEARMMGRTANDMWHSFGEESDYTGKIPFKEFTWHRKFSRSRTIMRPRRG